MTEYIYAAVSVLAIVAAWDAIRRWLAAQMSDKNDAAINEINEIKEDLAQTKARLADVITAVNFAKLQRGTLGRRVEKA